MTTAPHLVAQQRPSPFRGLDVCREAGFQLPANAHRPIFEHDRWDFTDVVGLPVDMPLANRRFDFAAITNLRWRQVAKELMLAMLVPRHPAVALLPRAYRTPLHLRSCAGRLDEIVKLFGWLGQRGITSLAQIDTHVSESYLAFRRYVIDESGQVVGEQSHAIRRAAAQVILDLVDYRELLTADRVRADLRPWNGASASAVAEMPSGRTENKTQPVADVVLQPMLAAALHMVTVLGPHAVTLHEELQHADRTFACGTAGLRHSAPTAIDDIVQVLANYVTTGTPLPVIEDHDIGQRLAAGWSPHDPLLPVATGVLARQAGYTQLWARWLPALRGPIRDAVTLVGVEKTFARQAVIPEHDLRKLLGEHGFSVANLSHRLTDEGAVFEYRMVIRSRDRRSAERLSQLWTGTKRCYREAPRFRVGYQTPLHEGFPRNGRRCFGSVDTSITRAMCSLRSRTVACASRRKRCTVAASSTTCGSRTLIATGCCK